MSKNDIYFAWSYPAQKYDEALHSLSLHFGPNWERMTFAIMSLTLLLESHFPDNDLFVRTRKIIDRATKFGPMMIGERIYWGSIENTMRKSRKITFEKLAREIYDIAAAIEIRRGSYQY